ncbi:hypothetical protein JL721_7424 [Aureococcus anophagefferens]|nr:hypothetical protein JL721_7424 [Aureococcus anophagefferens]
MAPPRLVVATLAASASALVAYALVARNRRRARERQRRSGGLSLEDAFGEVMTLSPSRTYRLLDGAGGSTLVVCVHGLTGDSRQFCYLAPLLASARRRGRRVRRPARPRRVVVRRPWRDDVGDAAVESIAAVVADAATRSRAADLASPASRWARSTRRATRTPSSAAPLAGLALICPVLDTLGDSSLERAFVASPLFPIGWSGLDRGAPFVVASQAGDFEKALAVGAHGAYARQAERHVAQQVRGNAGYVDRVGAEIRHLLSGERGDATFLQDALASVIRRPGRPKLLLVYGADDTVVGGGIVSHDEDALRAAAAVVVLDGAGHKPIMTHPQGVLDALRAHVL